MLRLFPLICIGGLLVCIPPAVGDNDLTTTRSLHARFSRVAPETTVPLPTQWASLPPDATVEVKSAQGCPAPTVSIVRFDSRAKAILYRFPLGRGGRSASENQQEKEEEEEPSNTDSTPTVIPIRERTATVGLRLSQPDGPETGVAPGPGTVEAVHPIQAQWRPYPFPTRPYTVDEFRLLHARHPLDGRWWAQDRFDVEPRERKREEEKKIPTVIGHLRALWHVKADGAFRFGTDSLQCCWFLFVDGQCVADWQNSAPSASSRRLSPRSIFIDAGLHAVDLFAVVKREEELPSPVVTDAKNDRTVALSSTFLLPPLNAASVNFARLGTAGQRVPVLAYRSTQKLLFEDSPELKALSATPSKPQDPAPFPARFAGVLPAVTVTAQTAIHDPPLLHIAGTPLELRCSATTHPPVSKHIADPLVLRATVKGPGGNLRAEQPLPVETRPGSTAFEMPVEQADRAWSVQTWVRDIPVTPPKLLRFVPPKSFGPPLAFAGPRLMIDHTPVCLVWAPSAPPPKLPKNLPPPKTLTILDDFWDIAPSPESRPSVRRILEENLPVSVRHLSIGSTRQRGIPDSVAKFALLLDALAQTDAGDWVLLALGHTDIAGDRAARDLAGELRYLATACLAQSRIPILLTLPPANNIAHSAVTRRAARYTKEVAVALDIPVVDAYSLLKMRQATAVPPAPAAARRSALRHWLTARMLDALLRL